MDRHYEHTGERAPTASADGRLENAAERAAALRQAHGERDAEDLLRALIHTEFPGRIALVSSFGTEAAVLLEMVARIEPALPLIFLDTEKLFAETLGYRDRLIAELGLRDVRIATPEGTEREAEDPDGLLHRRDPDRCCDLRKVRPLERHLRGFSAWITGRKRYQGAERSDVRSIEALDGRITVNPLVHWSREAVAAAFEARSLPRHPLEQEGYPSVGCEPCTTPVKLSELLRAGRWRGQSKTECGIHMSRERQSRGPKG